jgi:hypothetical protein
MRKRLRVVNNEAASLCGPCGGKCCQQLPGIYHPKDFSISDSDKLEKELYEGFVTKKLSVDWWEGNEKEPSLHFIRPRTVNARGVRDPSWGGACGLWSWTDGCALTFEERPYQCRIMVPNEDHGKCGYPGKKKVDKKSMGRAWLPYKAIIMRAAEAAEEALGE